MRSRATRLFEMMFQDGYTKVVDGLQEDKTSARPQSLHDASLLGSGAPFDCLLDGRSLWDPCPQPKIAIPGLTAVFL